jgi:hypothetical protein
MKPQVSDDAIPQPIAVPAPQRRRMPAGTAPIVRVAEGTMPVRQLAPSRPWLRFTIASVAVLSVATLVAYVLYARAARREAFEAQYPVIASAQDADVLERQAARWAAGEPHLLQTLAAFRAPPLDSLVGAGECPFSGTGLSVAASSDLAVVVRETVAGSLLRAERGRFASDAAVAELVAQLTGPVIVTAAGVRYAFDPATGALACAGTTVLRAVE